MGQLLISLVTRGIVLPLVVVVSLAGTLHQCRSSSNSGTPVNTNNRSNADRSISKPLELKVTVDKAEVGAGQCSDLRLTVVNSGTRPVRWKKDWVWQQQGPTILPESFPRSDIELSPGATTDLVLIRLCHSNLTPGTYRYRIRTSDNSARSNQVTIEVVEIDLVAYLHLRLKLRIALSDLLCLYERAVVLDQFPLALRREVWGNN